MPIVLATNLSAHARDAADVMAVLSKKSKLPLLLAYVTPAEDAESFGSPLRELLTDALRREADRVRASGATVETVLCEGELHAELSRLAETRSAELLVVTSGKPQVAAFGAGLSPSRFLPHLLHPLLMLHDMAPWRAFAEGRRPLKVMVGVDRSITTEAPLRWLRAVEALGPVSLTALRLYVPSEESERLRLPRPEFFLERNSEIEAALEREVHERLPDWRGRLEVVLEPSWGRMADQLVRAAETGGMDLLVVGTHRRVGLAKLGSVSHHTLRLAQTSVAVIPFDERVEPSRRATRRLERVLVPVDFSPVGESAVTFAYSLLAPGGVVHLCHFIPPEHAPTPELFAKLAAMTPADSKSSGISTVTEVLPAGDVASGILRAAERLDADVICLGTRGRRGPLRALMGSVARDVLEKTQRPTLLVHAVP